MSHFAKLDENNMVVAVFRGRQEDDGREAELSAQTGERYVQTSYNTRGGIHLTGGQPLRKNYAGIGYFYDQNRDAFIPPQPFPSWTLDEQSCQWQPPIPCPIDGLHWWNEQTQEWIAE
jgi:hypothetical protein